MVKNCAKKTNTQTLKPKSKQTHMQTHMNKVISVLVKKVMDTCE